MSRRSGVVVRADGMHFLPALVVTRIVTPPPIGRVPGAPPELAGVAQTENEIVPVVDLRDSTATNGVLVVCSYMGEPLGILVAEIVSVGHFDVDGEHTDSVIVGDARVKPLDLGKLYARLQSASFVTRVGG